MVPVVLTKGCFMGILIGTQIGEVGTQDDNRTPVYGGPALATTRDASTTTTGVQVTTDGRCRLVRFTAVDGAHRIQTYASANTSADTNYYYLSSGESIDLVVRGGTKFVYRLDA